MRRGKLECEKPDKERKREKTGRRKGNRGGGREGVGANGERKEKKEIE